MEFKKSCMEIKIEFSKEVGMILNWNYFILTGMMLNYSPGTSKKKFEGTNHFLAYHFIHLGTFCVYFIIQYM